MKRFVIIVLLSLFVFSLISCADAINKKFGFTPPPIIEPEDGNNGIISFDNNEDWHYHFFTNNEFSIKDSLTENLSCFDDAIEVTISGTPNMDVCGLEFVMHGGMIHPCFQYIIPRTFTKDEYFTETVEIPLGYDYHPNEDPHCLLRYCSSSFWNNSSGLTIKDFSISVKALKNVGFVMVKRYQDPDFNTNMYEHTLRSESCFFDDIIMKKYCNVSINCISDYDISNIILDMDRGYRICEFTKGENSIHISFETNNTGFEIGFPTLKYRREDLDIPIALSNFSFSGSFSDSPLYTVVDTNNWK